MIRASDASENLQQSLLWSKFCCVVEKHPNAIACRMGLQVVTYSQLHHEVLNLGLIYNNKLYRSRRVGLMIPKSMDLIVHLLACWYTDCVPIIIDGTAHKDKLDSLMSSAGLSLLLHASRSSANSDELVELPGCNVNQFYVRKCMSTVVTDTTVMPVLDYPLAAIVFTSGSSGPPKSVGLSHQALVQTMEALSVHYGLLPGQSIAWAASLSFDSALAEPLLALLSGSTLDVPQHQGPMVGKALSEYLCAQDLSHLIVTPSVLDSLSPSELVRKMHIVLVGEPLHQSTVSRWADYHVLYNAYGPSEATICVTVTGPLDPARHITVGRPLPHVSISILEDANRLQEPGKIGQIAIHGVSVSAGYLNDHAATLASFLLSESGHERTYLTGDLGCWDNDGNIILVGRCDHQVKVAGRRVNLGEVERALMSHTQIYQAVVMPEEKDGRIVRLASYIVFVSNVPMAISALRNHVAQTMPSHMIPSRWYRVSSMPSTSNGKIDRRALLGWKRHELMPGDYVPPLGAAEAIVARAVERIMNRSRIGREECLVSLGMTSIEVIALASELHALGARSVLHSDILASPTVAFLASHLSGEKSPATEDMKVSVAVDLSRLPAKYPNPRHSVPAVVFLTGVSGFLGRALLNSILNRTSAIVMCALRPGSNHRQGRMNILGMNDSCMRADETNHRVRFVDYDLSLPLIGFPKAIDAIKDSDVILHCGANVNLAYDYQTLFNVNVKATYDLIDASAKGVAKSFIYVSSRSASIAGDYSGYAQSKRSAESIVNHAVGHGLRGYIVRPGRLNPDCYSGVCNTNDFLFRFTALCYLTRRYPLGINGFQGMPVNQAAQAIVDLMYVQDEQPVLLDLIDSEYFSFAEIFKRFSREGVNITGCSVDAWCDWIGRAENEAFASSFPDVVIGINSYWSSLGSSNFPESVDFFSMLESTEGRIDTLVCAVARYCAGLS